MKLPPFTLVYRPGLSDAQPRTRERRLVAELGEYNEELPNSLRAIKPSIRRSLLMTVEPSTDRAGSAELLSQVTNDLQRQAKVEAVGFWDLSSQVGELPGVIEALNKVQTAFSFFEVQAAVPSGLISRPERVIAWAKEKVSLTKKDALEIGNNLIFEDFAERARKVRDELGLDHLLGIVPSMIAFEEEGDLFWNYFSMSEPGLVLASTFEVAQFARRAGQPFEVAVAGIAISTLLVTLNPGLEFHEEIRGCLFDFNRERDSIVKSLRKPTIEPSCLEKIQEKYRGAAEAIVKVLRELRPTPGGPAATRRGRTIPRKKSSSRKPLARPKAAAKK